VSKDGHSMLQLQFTFIDNIFINTRDILDTAGTIVDAIKQDRKNCGRESCIQRNNVHCWLRRENRKVYHPSSKLVTATGLISNQNKANNSPIIM